MRASLVVTVSSLACLFHTAPAYAAEVVVHDSLGLREALEGASPGDEIILEDGTYRLSDARCTAAGTEGEPIVVRARNSFGAVIELDGVEGFRVTGAHWRFEGLDIRGVCTVQSDCEHAFHVTGAAHGFVLRSSKVRDFNAQLKVNAAQVGGSWVQPNDGLIELSEIFDTEPRQTSSPVTKLNIDSGRGWVVRDSYIHDFRKAGGNDISYGAFMKSGGEDGIFERNLVVCSTTQDPEGTRIGLSFGGGGTGAQFCAPAFDAGVPCSVEHTGGIMRNNIVAGCSDVGIYLNRAADTKLLFNTLIGTAGIDFRFDTSSGVASGNLLSGRIRDRDGASHTSGRNLAEVDLEIFSDWYEAPLQGELALKGDVSALIGDAEAHPNLAEDYCGRPRAEVPTLGALEHSLGDCATVPPPGPGAQGGAGGGGGSGGALGEGGEGGAPDTSGGAGGEGGTPASGGAGGEGGAPDTSGGAGGAGGHGDAPHEGAHTDEPSCSCTSTGGSAGDALLYLVLGIVLVAPRSATAADPR